MSTRSTLQRIRRSPATNRPLRVGDVTLSALLLLPLAIVPLAALLPATPVSSDSALSTIALHADAATTATTASDLRTRRLAIEQRLQTLSDVERMGGVQTELIAELRRIAALEASSTTP